MQETTSTMAYTALSKEFDPLIALSVIQIHTINLSTKFKERDFDEASRRLNRISKKAKNVLYMLSDDEFKLSIKLWRVLHSWEVSQSLDGLGGCKAKTFTELLVQLREQHG